MSIKVKLLLLGVAILLVSSMAIACGDSGISQEDYDAVIAERDAAQAEVDDLEGQVAGLEASVDACEAQFESVAGKLLPDVLTILSVVDEIGAWMADAENTALLGALSMAINDTGHAGLIENWDVFLTASATGDPGMTLHQFLGYMLGECSYVISLFPASVQPVMSVGDEMYALVSALDIELLGQMTTAVNESGDTELIDRWNTIIATFQTDLAKAMGDMIAMQVWMLSSIAAAAPAAS
jgi:hypothetical protein